MSFLEVIAIIIKLLVAHVRTYCRSSLFSIPFASADVTHYVTVSLPNRLSRPALLLPSMVLTCVWPVASELGKSCVSLCDTFSPSILIWPDIWCNRNLWGYLTPVCTRIHLCKNKLNWHNILRYCIMPNTPNTILLIGLILPIGLLELIVCIILYCPLYLLLSNRHASWRYRLDDRW